MGDDGLSWVKRLNELPYDPVGRDRRFGGRELWQPLAEPGLPRPLNHGYYFMAFRWFDACILDGLNELAQHEFGVPQDGVIRRVTLVQVAFVVGNMNELFASRKAGVHEVVSQAAADTEDEICSVQVMVNRAGHNATTGYTQ